MKRYISNDDDDDDDERKRERERGRVTERGSSLKKL